MKTKIIQFIPALFVLLGVGSRHFSNWCIDSVSSCYGSGIHQAYQYFTSPLYFFSLFFLPLAIILAFVPRATFNSWLKFAAWTVPLLVIFIATQPVSPSSFLSTDRDDAARLAGQVFALISLLLIIWKYFAFRRSGQV